LSVSPASSPHCSIAQSWPEAHDGRPFRRTRREGRTDRLTSRLRNAISSLRLSINPKPIKKETQMLSRISLISAAVLIAGSLTAAAQQQLPQEPRGEDSSRSATPSNQLPGPNGPRGGGTRETTGQGTSGNPSGKIGPGGTGQSTPQEPRGEQGDRSATPSGEQPRPVPGQPGQK
jgi:hypothetical protein